MLPKLSEAGMAILLSSLPLLLLLILGPGADVLGFSLREHRLRGSELDPERGTPNLSPNADMLQALEYIERLHRQTGAAAPQDQASDYDAAAVDDTEKLRSMLRLASPARGPSQAGRGRDEEDEEEEGEDDEEDETQEWLQAVLSTLEQDEKSAKLAPVQASAPRRSLTAGQRPAKEEESEARGVAYQSAREQRGSHSHGKYPLMFEDVKGGDGGEDEEQRGSDRESPFKRTNENLEEKYTPQNLASLQSVFEELGRLANGKAGHKRQATAIDDDDDDDDEEDDDDANDFFRVENPDYDDVTGGEDWPPMEQQTEEDEIDNEELGDDEEDDNEYGDDEDNEENYQVKRSAQPGPEEDDITKLVDYYLFKVLEKTEEEEQKREVQEEQRAERRVAQPQYRDIDLQAIYQIIRISQKLQIPPEDLLDMLRTGETTKQDRTSQRNLAQTRMPNNLPGVEDKPTRMSSQRKNKSPPAKFYNRRLPETQTSNIPEDINTKDILNILGLGSVGNQKAAPLKQKQHKSSQSRFYAPAGRQRGYTLSQTHVPEELKDYDNDKLKDNYDDTVDEDEMATYLAAQMLAQYPGAVNNRGDQKRASQPPSDDEEVVLGRFEQAIQDYYDKIDSDKRPLQKRQSETEDMDGAAQTQPLDDEALLKILSLLNPTEESDDTDHNANTVKGM